MEEEWVCKSCQGDEEAFAKLVELYRPKILAHCLSLLHDVELAEDATQESFIRAFRALPSFERRSSFYTWLWKIAHRTSCDFLKKESRTSQVEEPLIVVKEEEPSDLMALLEHLSPRQRKVFELYYIEKVPQKEIAERLNLPYGTVRSRLHHARLKLRKRQREFYGS